METELQYLFQDIETCCAYLNPPKSIKVTSDFYNYLEARRKENFYFINIRDYPLAYFMGIKLVVDDTIDGCYDFEY